LRVLAFEEQLGEPGIDAADIGAFPGVVEELVAGLGHLGVAVGAVDAGDEQAGLDLAARYYRALDRCRGREPIRDVRKAGGSQEKAVVVLVGAGHLGGPILDRLALSPRIGRIVVLGRDARRGEQRCNLARLAAMTSGRMAQVSHRIVDVAQPDQVAAVVQEVSPDVVVHAASMQTWWLLDLFPEASRVALRAAGYGVWLPLHLALVVPLMQGLADGGYSGVVLNAAYPDVINVVLARLGRAPTGGVGNVDEIVAKIRISAAERLSVGAEELDIWLVAHHALQRFVFSGATGEAGAAVVDEQVPPFFLRVELRVEDVTEQCGADAALLRPCALPDGPGWGILSASSAVALVEAVLAQTPSRAHVPGPGGLPGGYPVDVGRGIIELSPIAGLARDEAVSINERSHLFDGIEQIGEDGAVVFTGDAAAAMRDAMGYDCRTLAPADISARAVELAARFREYATRHGVDIGAVGG